MKFSHAKSFEGASLFLATLLLAACSSADGAGSGPAQVGVNAPIASVGAGGAPNGSVAGAPSTSGGPTTVAGNGATSPLPGSGGVAAPTGTGGVASGSGGTGGTAGVPNTMPPVAAGPEDGDPAGAVIAITEVACGGPVGGFGLGSANFKFDGRDMIVTYPCNKRAGAPATFILNLHGTTPVAQHFYQHGYFAAHKYSASHNLIIVTPSSVVEQWGNGDGGVDEPHLMKIIDWVYATLNTPTTFDIRGMWVGGHSWGAMYTAKFGCKPELADKVKGLIIMSGTPTAPACTDRVALIDTNAEMDIAAPLNQASFPMSHGCDASMTLMVGNNTQTLWPNCDPGFVHSNYLMLGKMHADAMDAVVVESIVDLIKLSRQ